MPTPRKSTARSTPAKRGTAEKPRSRRSTNTDAQSASSGTADHRQAPPKSLRAGAGAPATQLAQLIGQTPEGIVAAEHVEDGWRVQVEVVESHRIPETTDILAVYEVDVDTDGAVTGYRRLAPCMRRRCS